MESANCYLDLFCARRGAVDVEILKKILISEDPAAPGIWYSLVERKYRQFMPTHVRRCFEFAITKADDPYINIVFVFFICMGFEPACQRIITKQLQRANMHRENAFFMQEFVKFARHSITIMLRYPITLDDAQHVFNTCVSTLQTTWLAQTTYFSIISTRFELRMRDLETQRRATEIKLKDALKASGRAKRQRNNT